MKWEGLLKNLDIVFATFPERSNVRIILSTVAVMGGVAKVTHNVIGIGIQNEGTVTQNDKTRNHQMVGIIKG